MGRNSTNILSLCITVGFLLVCMDLGRGERTSGIQRMTTEINRAIKNVLQKLEDIEYEDYVYTATYDSSTNFHPKGMNILYNLTNVLTKGLFPEVIPDALEVVNNNEVHIINDDYASVAKTYIPFLIFLSVLTLFAFCMPFCGFCFCCCRCCCNSGKPKPIEKNKDLCKKIIYATLMIGTGTLLLFGVVCAFVSNEHMQSGTEELTGNLRVTISDTRKYFNETNQHIELLLNKNFKQLSTSLLQTLTESSDILYDELKQITNASSIDDAVVMINTLQETSKKLETLKKSTNTLRVEASQLDDAMRKIKRDLLEDLNSCSSNKKCAEMKQEYVDKLGTGIDFNSIPDISDDINVIADLEKADLFKAIQEGEKQLEQLKDQIKENVNENIKTVAKKVNDAGREIEKHSKDVRKAIDNTLDELVHKSNDGLKIADDYIIEYSKYRYYVGMGVSCIFLFITVCVTLGLICGICGKKPTYGDDCCNKGAGSKFLMCGVSVMFLTAFFLVIILLIHIAGMFVQLLVCEPLRNPENNEVMDFYNENANLKKYLGLDTTLKNLTINCYKNKTIYEVFHLQNKFDIDEVRNYISKFGIDKELENLEDTITLETSTFELLSPEQLLKMKELGTNLSEIHNKFDRINEEIKIEDFTTVRLEELQIQLNNVIHALEESSGKNSEIANSLKLSALHLETYIEKLFKPMVENAKNTLALAAEMNEALKLKHDNFQAAILDMAEKIEFAQEELKVHGKEKIAEVIRVFSTEIIAVLQRYLDRIANSVENDVGKCGSLALVLNGTLTSTCDKIILPMTGFGVSILWCIMLFIPTIMFAVTLADLYKKTDTYHGYQEAGKYSGKKKHKKKRDSHHRYLPESEVERSEFPRGSQHHDARYSDMAPKHYEDFPNGGPPQYHRATEYERPPPYYCPGSTDH